MTTQIKSQDRMDFLSDREHIFCSRLISVNSGVAPYATEVFSFMQNEVTVTEADVPSSPPTTWARIFIDYRDAVDPVPGSSDASQHRHRDCRCQLWLCHR